MRILSGLPDRFEVCYEASCGYGHFHDLLRRLQSFRNMFTAKLSNAGREGDA